MTEHIYSLVVKSSFWEGLARLIDFGGDLNQYNYSRSGREADYRALLSDWQYVGVDLQNAIEEYEEEYVGKQNGK